MTTDQVFNKEEAMQRVDDDVELFAELVTMFFDDWPTSVANLEDACRRQAASEVQHLAHSMKSALGNLGGMRAYRSAFQIEMAGKSGNITEATAHLESFKTEVEEFKKEASKVKGA
jgi:HPt (histidine-containing phosphotransfer) domain-containing protein